jgi:hypothetical protein
MKFIKKVGLYAPCFFYKRVLTFVWSWFLIVVIINGVYGKGPKGAKKGPRGQYYILIYNFLFFYSKNKTTS